MVVFFFLDTLTWAAHARPARLKAMAEADKYLCLAGPVSEKEAPFLGDNILDPAIAYYRQAMELNPEYVEANGALGMMLIENDLDIEEGLRLLEVALEGDQVNESYLQWKGWGLYAQGRNEEALVLLERAWDLSNQYNHDLDEQLDEVRLAVIRQNQ